MNTANNLLFWLLYFVITVLVAWIALSLILLWIKPMLFNEDGSVNWLTTLWVAALVILLAWLIRMLIQWLVGLFMNRCDPCTKNACDPCPPACPDPCDPCAKKNNKNSYFF